MKRFTEQEKAQMNAQALGEFKVEVEKRLRKKMIEKNVGNDGDLYNSLKAQLQNPNVMSFAFSNYGRHIDMRNTDFGSPPFEEIKKWVKKEGLSKFKFAPGYKTMPSESIALDRIAWGVRHALAKGETKRKRKAWYSKTFWGAIDFLIERLIDIQKEKIRNEISGKII
ncbi:hypothetical protein [Bernardetia sp.]|uniref:hypothetical protein n=1 Tax=Bernardetia sp. TaxID=1937974 RepID=UPI0025BA84BC|nr:hypothetical protein [Bernardetia sp.]